MKLSNKIAVLLCTLGILFLSSCKKDASAPEVDIFKNTEWRGKVNLESALNKKTAYYVIKFFGDKTFRISAADAGGMIYKDLKAGTYKLVDGHTLKLYLENGGAFSFLYRERDSRSYIYAGYYGVNMYRQ